MVAENIKVDEIKAHVNAYKFTRDNCTVMHEKLFTKHPEFAKYWDAEDIDPEKLCKSMKFQSIGAEEMRNLFGMAMAFGQAMGWRQQISQACDHYKEMNVPITEVWMPLSDAICDALEKHAGGCTPAQRDQMHAVFGQALEDAKSFGMV